VSETVCAWTPAAGGTVFVICVSAGPCVCVRMCFCHIVSTYKCLYLQVCVSLSVWVCVTVAEWWVQYSVQHSRQTLGLYRRGQQRGVCTIKRVLTGTMDITQLWWPQPAAGDPPNTDTHARTHIHTQTELLCFQCFTFKVIVDSNIGKKKQI